MSLYNKYRPQSLEDVKGNDTIIISIKNMLSNIESCPHSFLIHGETGCGKTTIGRIIAKELGCKGQDFIEVDSGQLRGIDTIRDIREKTVFQPLEGNSRVWLLDEVHKTTNDAQNALLKILEDPPRHCYFILCTTDPQKLIATIKGRCQEFQVKPLNEKQTIGLLRMICRKEKEIVTLDILEQIAENSLGHPRNAIQILEQVLNVPEEKRKEIAQQYSEEQLEIIELCRALIKRESWKKISKILQSIKDQDPETVRRIVLGYMQSILLKTDNVLAGMIMEYMIEPFYNTGFPGLTFACYSICKTE